ncbi:MAG: hypothetical protein U5J96_02870 [Ignavibacteriaceae bacterium]|nr:hypothetical protein [Ignavibacteriaceae bacterium]
MEDGNGDGNWRLKADDGRYKRNINNLNTPYTLYLNDDYIN